MTIDAGVPAPFRASVSEPAVSWSAVFAGAVAALVASLLLTLAAAGLGFATAPSALPTRDALAAFTPEVGAGAVLMQVLSAAFGGFLAGRLRTVWRGVHSDEAHFRDTAHGLLAWALSALVGMVLAAAVLTPAAQALAANASPAAAAPTAAQAMRAAHIASQASLFVAVGMLLSAFAACSAGRLGGMAAESAAARYEG